MGIFITQGNYTQSAMKGMIDNPDDREAAVGALMTSIGGKLLSYYMTTGEYDFLLVAEADNVTSMMSGLLIAGATGGVTNLKTTSALTMSEGRKAMETANKVRGTFRPAGSKG